MIIDYYGVLSDAQAETTATTHYSDNMIDCEIANANLGKGNDIYFKASVNTEVAFVSGATVTVGIADCDTSGGTFSTLVASEAYTTTGGIAAGTELLHVTLPKEHKRFLQAFYTIGTAALTAGKFDAYLYVR